jgi:hypothetical protein
MGQALGNYLELGEFSFCFGTKRYKEASQPPQS